MCDFSYLCDMKKETLYTSKVPLENEFSWFVVLAITAAIVIVSLNIVIYIVSS